MKQLAGILEAGLIALDGGVDRIVGISPTVSSAIHVGCAVGIAMLSVYLAAPVYRLLQNLRKP